jgi:hypothetical protein
MGQGFNIVKAVVTLYFLPVDDGKAGRGAVVMAGNVVYATQS